MNRPILLVAILGSIAGALVVNDPIYNRGASISHNSRMYAWETVPVDECNNQVYSCANCTATRLCVPNADKTWRFVKDINCTGSTPYCNKATGSCESEPDTDCGLKDDFICVQDGFFPDSTNCTKYHVCNNSVDNAFDCGKHFYDPQIKDCVSTSANCAAFACAGEFGRKVPHKVYNSYFAYCDGDKPPVIDRCQGNYELNVTSQECEPPCIANGAVASNEDCTKFFICNMVYYKKDVYIPELTLKQCPPKMAFDPVHLVCTTDVASIPNCHV